MAKQPDFEDILPLLVSTYQQGRLVPFLGAGMSVPMLTLWDKFVHELEHKAGLPRHAVTLSPDARAQRACTIIENRYGRKDFLAAVRNALETTSHEVPKSTISLAQIRWPLVISTNYDDLFFYACRCRRDSNPQWADEIGVQVLGRSARDCKLVISSLTGPFDRQYIWHVQGFLGGQSPDSKLAIDFPDIKALQDQLVIGHSEYRRVTNRAPDFRRCFTEVFNTRSFLFLGSSLKEDYFLNLFGEVLDLCGPSAVPHFAFTKKGEVDANFLADQMNITVCECQEWEELPSWLDRLKEEIDAPKARSTSWSFSIGPSSDPRTAKPDLEILRGFAPKESSESEVVAFVAGRENGHPKLRPPFGYLVGEPHCEIEGREHIIYYPRPRVYAVTAHCRKNDDDSAVEDALRDLVEAVVQREPGTTTVHF